MDFVKKHWEKILLAAALLALIFVGLWLMLKIDAAQAQDDSPISGGRAKGEAISIDRERYNNGLQRLQNPFLWVRLGTDPFDSSVEPSTPTVSTNGTEGAGTIRLVRVQTVPFEMLFKAYIWDQAKQQGHQFQLDFAFRNRTFFVAKVGDPVGDRFEKSDYVIADFQRKIIKVLNPNLGQEVPKDVSELTLRRAQEEPITLVLGRPGWQKEPVATIRCHPEFPAAPQTFQVRRGQQFVCAGTTYIVVDIAPQQVLIRDANKPEEKPKPIDLPAPAALSFPRE